MLITVEIATSAPRGGNHMGQVGVVKTGHMVYGHISLHNCNYYVSDSNHVSWWRSVEYSLHNLWGRGMGINLILRYKNSTMRVILIYTDPG